MAQIGSVLYVGDGTKWAGASGGVQYSDTAAMLAPYQRSAFAMKYSDTALMLSHYFNMTAVNSLLALKVSFTDTVSMLSHYYNKTYIDASLAAITGAYLPLAGGTMTGQLILPSGNGNIPLKFNYSTANTNSRSFQIYTDQTFGTLSIQRSQTQTGTTYDNLMTFDNAGSVLIPESMTLGYSPGLGLNSFYAGLGSFSGDISSSGTAGDRTIAVQSNTSGDGILSISAGGVGTSTIKHLRGTNVLSITSPATTFSSNVTASAFIKSGGLSTQYLMADGSVSTTGGGITTNALTMNNSGSGATSGTTFNGSAAQTISYNTIGASPLAGSASLTTVGTLVSGAIPYSLLTGTVPTWNQNTTGTAANITATSNSTITTLSALSLPYSQLTGAPTISGSNTGDVTLATNSGLGFVSGQTGLALGTPTSVTGSSTNSVTTNTHTHAVSGLTNTNLSGSAGITVANGGTGVGTLTGLVKGNGTSAFTAAVAGTDYQTPLTFSTGLTNTTGTITVNTSQNISTLSNLTSNGLIKTSGGTGALSIAAAGTDYQAPITLTTTGTSGAATLISNTLNIPQYSGGGVSTVAALTLGTTGTDLNSSVANPTTTPVITLNVPDASVTNRGVVTTGTQTFVGLKSVKGTTVSDLPTLGTETMTTGSGTNWAGTNFATGYTHTAGSAVALVAAVSPSSGAYYYISATVSGLTAGFINFSFGGGSILNTMVANGTKSFGWLTTSTAALNVVPSSTFVGTVIVSVKQITTSSATFALFNSSGTSVNEWRADANTGNTFEGLNVGARNYTGTFNTAIGNSALQNNITGINEVAIGYQALASATDFSNSTAIGYQALSSATLNTSGNNTAVGYLAGKANTTTSDNTFIGAYAGQSSTGSAVTFIGSQTGLGNTSGALNVAVGTSAYNSGNFNNVTAVGYGTIVGGGGNNVTAIGGQALSGTTGADNTALGYIAGKFISGGVTSNAAATNSVYIGSQAYPLASGQANQIVIGYQAVGIGANTTTIGNGSTVSAAIRGNLLLGSTTDNSNGILQATGNGIFTGNLTSNNGINGYTTTATAAGTTTLLVTSTYQQYFTGTTTQTVVLPVATTLVNGYQLDIVNNSTGLVTVQTSGGNVIQALASNTELVITCINTAGGTGTASWGWRYFPVLATTPGITALTTTGASGAATLTGSTLNVPNYTLSGLGGISGSGVANQITYWSGTSATTGSADFTWDNTNKNLLVNQNGAGYIKLGQSSGTNGFVQSANSNFLWSSNVRYNGTNWIYDANGYGAQMQVEGLTGTARISTAPTGTAGGTATMTQHFIVGNTGRVFAGANLATDDGYSSLSTDGIFRVAYSTANPAFLQAINSNTFLTNNIYHNGTNYIYAQTGFGAELAEETTTGTIYMSTAISGTATTTATMVQHFKLLNAGRILMGTTLPTDDGSSDLQVKGEALIHTLTVGLGTGSLANNTAIGYQTLHGANSGTGANVAVGYQAGFTTTTGAYNTAVGTLAGYSNLSGNYNTSIGDNTSFTNSTGSYNMAVGHGALYYNTSDANTSFGYESLFYAVGTNNIAQGWQAGKFITGGVTANALSDNSVYLGAATRALASGQTNQIVIGYNAVGLGSNSTVIGNSTTVSAAIYGNLMLGGIVSNNGVPKLDVTGKGYVTDTLQGGTIKRIGGLSTQYLMADGSVTTGGGGGGTITLTGAVTGSGTTTIATTLASSIVAPSNINATGTPSSTTYFRGDGTWSTPSGAGTVTSVATNTGSGITGGTITGSGTIAADTTTVLSTKANVVAKLLGYTKYSDTATMLGHYYNKTYSDANFVNVSNSFQSIGTGKVFQGNASTDFVTFGEILTTASATNWTGSSWATGYTHTPGSTVSLIDGNTLSGSNTYYLSLNIPTMTAGTCDVWLDGIFMGTITGSSNLYYAINETTGTAFTLIPSSTFDGTVVASLKIVTPKSPILTISNYSGTEPVQISNDGNYNFNLGNLSNQYNYTGVYNTSIGLRTLSKNVLGSANIAVGPYSLSQAATPTSDIAIGVNSMSSVNDPASSYNIAIGESSFQNLSGSNNIGIGYLTGLGSNVIDNSILIGNNTTTNASGETNEIAIGYSTTGLGSNTTLLGNSYTTRTKVFGSLEQTSITPTLTKVDGSGKFIAAVSGTDYATPASVALKVKYTDTATMLSTHPNKTYVDNNVATKLNISDTALLGGTNYYNKTYIDANLATKAPAFTYTTNFIPFGQGTTTPNQSSNLTYNGTAVSAPQYIATATTSGTSTQGAFAYGTLGYTDINHILTMQASQNSYIQMEIQNTNSGAAASSDVIVTNNSGTATTFYGDFGMNSSGWVGSGAFNTANTVYITATSGDLALGTTTSNAIHLVVNGGTTDAVTVSNTGTVTIPNLSTAGIVTNSAAGLLSTTNGTGFIKNNGSGTISYDNSTYLTSSTGVTTFSAGTTGFTPSSATSGAITLSGTLIAGNGGTGQSTYAVGDLLSANTTTTLSKIADVAAGQPLLSGGVSTLPAYAGYTFSGTAAQTYTFPTTTKTLAANDGSNMTLSSQAIGDLIYANSTTSLGRIADVASGSPLISGGAGVVPAYAAYLFSGTSAATYTFPTASKTISANDGSNWTISGQAIGDIPVASSTTAYGKLADAAVNNVLLSGGAGVAPSYGKVGLTTHITGTLALGNGGTGGTTAPTALANIAAQSASLTATTVTAGATVTWTPVAGSSQYSLTPAQTETINMGTVPAAMVGQVVYLEINTSGTTSFTLTFGTNIKTATSTLATGTVTAKLFVIAYLIQSTTNVVELYRTVAQ